jgi:hypothetical protein
MKLIIFTIVITIATIAASLIDLSRMESRIDPDRERDSVRTEAYNSTVSDRHIGTREIGFNSHGKI